MRYELYYWPGIQGRGEFVRLALEEAGADYVDVGRTRSGMAALERVLEGRRNPHPPFALPALKAGTATIAETANILFFLGPRLGLSPESDSGRQWAHQLQLTIADFVGEIHGCHHPISGGLYYKDQKREAKRYAEHFRKERVPKFLNYFEDIIARNGRSHYATGRRLSHVDLSLFQVMAGLHYAFPRAMARARSRWPRLTALQGRVAARPRVAAYLASDRRLPFNTQDVFRHYPELDVP
jgi:glutathione S-transferase